MAEQQIQQGVYLSKQGKVFGPFTRAQIEQLKRTGEFLSYSFMWDPVSSPDWKPVSMPPGPPPAAEQVLPSRFPPVGADPQASAAHASQDPSYGLGLGTGSPGITASSARFQVICHDNRQALAGVLVLPSIRGFTLLTEESSSSLPPFGQGNKVWINLLDEESGRTENFQAGIAAVASREGKWAFEVIWEKPSAIVSQKVSFGKF